MEIQMQVQRDTMKTKMWDIIVDVSWAQISQTWAQISQKYFGKSRSWLSQKLTGINGNGKETEFTEDEKEILKGALVDLSNRIRVCADKI